MTSCSRQAAPLILNKSETSKCINKKVLTNDFAYTKNDMVIRNEYSVAILSSINQDAKLHCWATIDYAYIYLFCYT